MVKIEKNRSKHRLSKNNIRGCLRVPNTFYVSKQLENLSLDDMIAASRLVVAREEGFIVKTKIASPKAENIAIKVYMKNRRKNIAKDISFQQLNRAIIAKNEKENKPSKRVKALYQKLCED